MRSSVWQCTDDAVLRFLPDGCAPSLISLTANATRYILSDTLGVEEVYWQNDAFRHRDGRILRDPIQNVLDNEYGAYRWLYQRVCLLPLHEGLGYVAVARISTRSGAGGLWATTFSFDGSVPTVVSKLDTPPVNSQPMISVDFDVVENQQRNGYWILVLSMEKNGIAAYPVRNSRIGTAVVTRLSQLLFDSPNVGIAADPSGNRLAMSGTYGSFALARFDRSTGVVSDEQIVPVSGMPGAQPREDLAFSPDGSKLYVNLNGYNTDIAQFDLTRSTVEEISSSMFNILNTTNAAWWTESDIYPGPDGRIYVTIPFEIRNVNGVLDTSSRIAIIHCPNLPGVECTLDTVTIPSRRFFRLPRTCKTWLTKDIVYGVSDTMLIASMDPDSLIIVPDRRACFDSHWIFPDGSMLNSTRLALPWSEVRAGNYRFVQWRCLDTISSTYIYRPPFIRIRLPDTTVTVGSNVRIPIYVNATYDVSADRAPIIDVTFESKAVYVPTVSGAQMIQTTVNGSNTTLQIQLPPLKAGIDETVVSYLNALALLGESVTTTLAIAITAIQPFQIPIELVNGSLSSTTCSRSTRLVMFTDSDGVLAVRVYNLTGDEILRFSSTSSDINNQLRNTSLVRGIYVVRVSTTTQQSSELHFVP